MVSVLVTFSALKPIFLAAWNVLSFDARICAPTLKMDRRWVTRRVSNEISRLVRRTSSLSLTHTSSYAGQGS